jgi:hypothetical protein
MCMFNVYDIMYIYMCTYSKETNIWKATFIWIDIGMRNLKTKTTKTGQTVKCQ